MLQLTPEQIEKAQRNDKDIIDLIVRKSGSQLYNVIYQLVKNREDAEDVLQETYIKMLRNLKNFRGESSLGTWLYRIATNTALEKIRKNRPIKGMQDFQDEEFQEVTIQNTFALDEYNPEKTMMKDEFKSVLQTYLQELPEKTRMIFVMRDQDGLSLEEIVQITGDTEWSVKGRLKRARGFLREKLANYVTEGKLTHAK